MLCERFLFVITLTRVVSFCGGRTIQDQILTFDFLSNKSKPTDVLVNESYKSMVIGHDQFTNKTVNSDISSKYTSEKKQTALNGNSHVHETCPFKSNIECSILLSLSKIAKVDVAVPDQTSRGMKTTAFHSTWKDAEKLNLNKKLKGNEGAHFVGQQHFETVSKKQMKSLNVHCRAIHEVYIPEAKQNLPAFACKFGSNTFILTSTRFLQDRRLNLDINVNEDIFKNVKRARKISRGNKLRVLPALLVLNVPNNDYRIEARDFTSDERKVDSDEKN
ncbi:uncharacterized protein LOC116426170 [Nomia melanderi]|uniref:uncharacterized protein LOC116426170 n=1 Tax=Nomia melanderi TaxID=2448451 RepID=UPI0013043738|nr:uncharacterized protein LOC116426170 [Nomia melanderi]